jgi:hypothetical protein
MNSNCHQIKEAYEKLPVARGKIIDAIKNWPQVKKSVSAGRLIEEAAGLMGVLEEFSEKFFIEKVLPSVKLGNSGEHWFVEEFFNDENDETAKNLARILTHPRNMITRLAIDSKKVPQGALSIIFDALRSPYCRVFDLYLENCDLDAAAADTVCAELVRPGSKLRQLALNENDFGDAGARKIAHALADPACNLEKIGLQENNISDTGALDFNSALSLSSCKLKNLFLARNMITGFLKARLQKDSRFHLGI